MRKLENKSFEEIARALTKSAAKSPCEIDRIAENPALFERIRREIASGNVRPAATRSILRPASAIVSSLMLVAVATGFGYMFIQKAPDVVRSRPIAPALQQKPNPNIKKFSEPDRAVEASLPPEQAVVRPERASTRTASTRPVRARQPEAHQVRKEGDFYAVSYAGDPNETERGGRIVRVDIPRSTLFAMGVDIPLENDRETVKADLLIGNDGVTRAIRVVE